MPPAMKTSHAHAVATALFIAAVFPTAANAAERGPLTAEDELKTFQVADGLRVELVAAEPMRSEEHTSELQSLV